MVLGHAAADLDDGRLLEGVGADDGRAHLAGDGQQRHAVELGVGDGGDEVRGAGPLVAMQTPTLPVERA